MTVVRQSPAEETAGFLVQAGRTGRPVLIPGTFEKRAGGTSAELRSPPDVVTDHARSPAASDLERLEYEREGGGAPSARVGRRQGTLWTRLWHSLLHPAHTSDTWRRVLPQRS